MRQYEIILPTFNLEGKTLPLRDEFENIVGEITNIRHEGDRIVGDIQVTDAHLRQRLQEASQQQPMSMGLSIRTMPDNTSDANFVGKNAKGNK